MRKIYIACPYSGTPEQRVARVRIANAVAARLMLAGNIVFSPITHGPALAEQCDLPHDWSFWEAQDRAFLEWADVLVVVRAPGWEESRGVMAEIEIAKNMQKHVEFIDE